MANESDYLLFQPGKTVLLKSSPNYNCIPYLESVMRVIAADAVGVLAQLALDGSPVEKPVIFLEFDGETQFSFVAPGFYKYGQLQPTTPVIDLGSGEKSTMGDFYGAFFDRPQPAPQPAPAPAPAPVAGQPQVAPEPDWTLQFQPGTVYQLANTTNPALGRYVGVTFQSTHASTAGVLGIPERNSGLAEAVFLPFDGTSEFTLNPPGTYSFASGLGAGQQVYNPVTSSYVVVEEFCPAYGYYYDPFMPVVYYDTFVPSVALGVGLGVGIGYGMALEYDPYYVDPYWY
jgi:hypothetical protein